MNQFDTIHDSLINGQKEQAHSQMLEIKTDLPEMFDYFANELNQPELAIKAAKVFFIVERNL